MSEQRVEEGVQYIHKSNFKDALRKCSLLRLYWLSLVPLKISDESERFCYIICSGFLGTQFMFHSKFMQFSYDSYQVGSKFLDPRKKLDGLP